MPSRLIHRHDQFFKRLLDQPGAAGALLHERLPPKVAALLADDVPELLAGSFVPKELAEYRTDRLFRARTKSGRPVFIHVVVEHKSAPDQRVGLQLMGYATQILQWWDRREGRSAEGALLPLPAVMSMVVYNGEATWNVPLSLSLATDADEELRPWLPDLRYTLVDLGRIDDGRLSREQVLRIGFLILKHGAREADLRETLLTLGRAALALGFDDLVALVRYVLAEPNEVEGRVLRDVLAEIVPGKEERIMSIAAEQWKAEGKVEGMVLGQRDGQARSLIRLLEKRFGPVPEAVRARVTAAEIDVLDQWLDRVLDAPTLDAVFGDGKSH